MRAVTLTLIVAFPFAASADPDPSPATATATDAGKPAPPTAEPRAAPPPALAPEPPSLDFDLLGDAPAAAADPALAAEVARRRRFLTIHQAAGITTWALMGATVAVGQLNYRDLYGGGGYTERYRTAHRALALSTAGAFAVTGALAVLAPEPYPKKLRLDTATIHKVSMAVTTVGLVAQVVLGVWARDHAGDPRQRDVAAAHQALGYATFAAMTVGGLTLLF